MTRTERLEVATGYRWRWVALLALLVAEAMNLLDTTIVAVASPVIHRELGGTVADVPWFSAAYTLAFAVLLVSGGRLGDAYGRRRVFRFGVGLFGVASLACAVAPSVWLLIGFRAAQGVAAALIIPQTIGLIKTMFHGSELPRALGSIGPVMGLAAVLGPVLGGVLTNANLFGSSWRAVFLVNVPLSVLVLAVAALLRESHAPARPGLDVVGTLLAATGTGSLVYPLIAEVRTAAGWMILGAGVLLLAGFAAHQRVRAGRGASSLVEVSLFSGRVFPSALLTSTLFFAVTSGLTLVVVLHAQLGSGMSVLAAGLTLVPWSVGLAVASWYAGAVLVPHFGSRLIPVGLLVLLAGLLGSIGGYAADNQVLLLAALATVGIGVGLFSPAFFTGALHVVRPQEIGSAAGLINALQQLGATLGVAVLGRVYLGHTAADPPAAARLAFEVAALLIVAAMVSSAPMTKRGDRQG